MTVAEQIEAREFTYCSAFYPAELTHQHFIVMTADADEARQRAEKFARGRWGKPGNVNVYPRTYVRKARVCLLAGLHD